MDDVSQESARIAIVQSLHGSSSCRTLAFNSAGDNLYSGGGDGSLHGIDSQRGDVVWTVVHAHSSSVNRVSTCLSDALGPWAILSGDENGEIRLWDARQGNAQRAAMASLTAHTDFVADMMALDAKHVVSVGGDGRLAQFNLRKSGGLKLAAQSEEEDTEFLSLVGIKSGKKIVVGTQEGPLVVFSKGKYSNPSDSYPGHPLSVDCLLKVNEDVVLTGSSDGIIRIVQMFPHKVLGVVGYHDDFPVERMSWSHDRDFIATCSHDNLVRFWDLRFLKDLDQDMDGVDMERNNRDSDGGDRMDEEAEHGGGDDDGDDDDDEHVQVIDRVKGGQKASRFFEGLG